MTHMQIRTAHAPEPGNYSQARAVDLGSYLAVYIAGQTGNDPITDNVVEGGIGPQTTQALANIQGILEAVGGRLEHIVDMTVFLENMARDKKDFEAAYVTSMPKPLPARALVEVTHVPLLSEDTVVELKAIAYVPKKRNTISSSSN
ncbi:MAG: RidA family protein [archaeon]